MPRLGDDDYVRPEVTYTNKLSKDEIKEKLIDYKKTDDLEETPLGTHIRYFAPDKNGDMQFRIGGTLINKSGLPDYIILSNNGKTWSVQVENAIFFTRITLKQLKSEYDEIIKEKDKKIKQLITLNRDLLKELSEYKKNEKKKK